MSMAYIRSYYNVPAKRGARVRYNGKPGVIVGSNGARLKIRLDGERSAKAYHPMWHIEYIESARPAPAGSEESEAR